MLDDLILPAESAHRRDQLRRAWVDDSRPARARERARRRSGDAPADRVNVIGLLTRSGGSRYAGSVLVSSLGGGLTRPFLLLYAVVVSHLSVAIAGAALSLGFLAGLASVPLTGRWVDRGARTGPMIASLLLRTTGFLVLLVLPGPVGYVVTCLALGTSNQMSPVAGAALISTVTRGRDRDAALAAMRSLANAGMGAGALLATVAVTAGHGALVWLALSAAACYLAAAVAIATMPVPAGASRAAGQHDVRPRLSDDDRAAMRRLRNLNFANLPFAFCFDVLEVALPAVLVTTLHVSPAWSSAIFVANTVLVIAVQLPVVLWLARMPRRTAFARSGVILAVSYLGFWAATSLGGDLAAAALSLVSVLYTLGEITYTGVNTALVVDAAPAHLLGRALARWQLSAGIGRTLAPITLTLLLSVTPTLMWTALAATTSLGAWAALHTAPTDTA